MTNKINNWLKPDEVTEPGSYVVKYGDVETIESLEFVELNEYILDADMNHPSEYNQYYKFAKLEF